MTSDRKKTNLSDQAAINDGTSKATEKDFDFEIHVIYKDASGKKVTKVFDKDHPMDLSLIQKLFTESGTGLSL